MVVAVVATRFGDDVLADVLRLPGTPLTEAVLDAARSLGQRHRGHRVLWSCPEDDRALATALGEIGAVPTDELMIETWTDAAGVPTSPRLPVGYSLERRSDHPPGTLHHLTHRNGERVAQLLAQTSLYRPDFDLSVRGPDGDVGINEGVPIALPSCVSISP